MDFKEQIRIELDNIEFTGESQKTLQAISIASDLAISIMENTCRKVLADYRKKLELEITQHPLGSQELGDLVYSV